MPLALPALAAVAAALMALLAMYGVRPLAGLLARLFSGVPGVGGWISHNIMSAADWAVTGAQVFLDSFIAPIANAIAYPVTAVMRLIDASQGAFHGVLAALASIVRVQLPRAVHMLETSITQAWRYAVAVSAAALTATAGNLYRTFAAAFAHTVALIGIVQARAIAEEQRLAATIGQLSADTVASLVKVEDYATRLGRSVLSAATSYAAALYARAVTYVDAKVAALAGVVSAGLAKAEADAARMASTAQATAIRTVDLQAGAAAAALWPAISSETAALSGVLGADLPDIGAAVRAIPATVPLDLAAALAGVGALSIPALRFMRECGIPNCRNLSGLGRDLQALLGMVEDAAFLALIAAMITDPAAAARDIIDVAGPVATDTISAARSLLGV